MEKNNNMKTVLAELHELINDLEDQGLIAEASTLQEVFVRVAEEADMDEMEEPTEGDDLANDVAGLLKSHSASEVLAEIAKQMGGTDSADETSSFAYYGGNSDDFEEVPIDDNNNMTRREIVQDFIDQYMQSMQSNEPLNPNDLRENAQKVLDNMVSIGEIARENAEPVRVEEITRGYGYNAQANMAKELGGENKGPFGRGYPSPNN
jgi:uncharacterized protein (DUF2267 family)